jgi:hypothetical protein
MNKFLSILLIETKESLAGRILQMDESLRIGNNDFSYKSSHGMNIKSFQYPEVSSNAIYLRGCWTVMDDNVFVGSPLRETVSSLRDRIILSLKEFLKDKFQCDIKVNTHTGYTGELLIDFYEFDGVTQCYTKE